MWCFVGDTMFMPDYGTARADFPGGDAEQLFNVHAAHSDLPGETRLFMCHDYKAPGRDHFAWETTVAEERENVHLRGGVPMQDFVKMRTERDATCRRRCCCCRPSRSTSAPANCRRRKTTACAISRSRSIFPVSTPWAGENCMRVVSHCPNGPGVT